MSGVSLDGELVLVTGGGQGLGGKAFAPWP